MFSKLCLCAWCTRTHKLMGDCSNHNIMQKGVFFYKLNSFFQGNTYERTKLRIEGS